MHLEMHVNDSKNMFKAILAQYLGHGKSPCFLAVAFLQLVSPD